MPLASIRTLGLHIQAPSKPATGYLKPEICPLLAEPGVLAPDLAAHGVHGRYRIRISQYPGLEKQASRLRVSMGLGCVIPAVVPQRRMLYGVSIRRLRGFCRIGAPARQQIAK